LVAIKDEFLEKPVTLRVVVTSTANLSNSYERITESNEFERILNPGYVEKLKPSFSLASQVKVVQPFSVIIYFIM
jgi:hypothetical protein